MISSMAGTYPAAAAQATSSVRSSSVIPVAFPGGIAFAALLPFGPFVMDRKLRREATAR